MAFLPFLSGFLLGGSLIISIGAQNAFLLRQGLLEQHVFVLCLICAVSDALLITAGVAGVGTLVAQSPLLSQIATIGGIVFLLGYALFSFRRALKPDVLKAAKSGAPSLRAAIAACLAFTYLNPNVYLETVLLVGSVSAGYAGSDRVAFGAGAVTVSFVWFFGLGYGARLLQPVFARPLAWRVLDCATGVVMTSIAIGLLRSL
ncbi:MAG: amino acid transporter [Rhizobiaceae bacterium]|jgi:L-lysine exporter family protein LysE/ArgO|nr:amino acid transporter [Rhizobiaceae bacterium]